MRKLEGQALPPRLVAYTFVQNSYIILCCEIIILYIHIYVIITTTVPKWQKRPQAIHVGLRIALAAVMRLNQKTGESSTMKKPKTLF